LCIPIYETWYIYIFVSKFLCYPPRYISDMDHEGDLRSRLSGQEGAQSDWNVLKTVLSYSVLILLLPIGSFFATKSLLFEWFLGQTATIGTNIVSAVVAVIVLHLALGLFIYKAYFDDGKKAIKSDWRTNIVYNTALYCTVLYCTVLYCTVLYCTILNYTLLYNAILHCKVLFSTVVSI